MGTFEIMGVTTGYLFFQGNGRKPHLRHYDEVFVKYGIDDMQTDREDPYTQQEDDLLEGVELSFHGAARCHKNFMQ